MPRERCPRSRAELFRDVRVIHAAGRPFSRCQDELAAVEPVAAVVERLQVAVAEGQKPRGHPSLVALSALFLQIHLALGRDHGLYVVGLAQCLDLHIVVHHQENVLQVGPGKAVFGDFGDAAILHIAAEQPRRDGSDLTFALAAAALDDHHPLSLCAGDEAVAEIFLQRGYIFGIEKAVQKQQPLFQRRRVGPVSHGQAAADNLGSAVGESTVQSERAVCQMDVFSVRAEVVCVGGQLQDFDNIADLFRDVVAGAALESVVYFTPQRQIICDSAVQREELATGKHDLPRGQKLVAEQRLVDVFAVEPDGAVSLRSFAFHRNIPPCSP